MHCSRHLSLPIILAAQLLATSLFAQSGPLGDIGRADADPGQPAKVCTAHKADHERLLQPLGEFAGWRFHEFALNEHRVMRAVVLLL
jgi:hypothetical protein